MKAAQDPEPESQSPCCPDLRTGAGGGGNWIRTSEGVSQQIYSLPPLATWVSHPCRSDTVPRDGPAMNRERRPTLKRFFPEFAGPGPTLTPDSNTLSACLPRPCAEFRSSPFQVFEPTRKPRHRGDRHGWSGRSRQRKVPRDPRKPRCDRSTGRRCPATNSDAR